MISHEQVQAGDTLTGYDGNVRFGSKATTGHCRSPLWRGKRTWIVKFANQFANQLNSEERQRDKAFGSSVRFDARLRCQIPGDHARRLAEMIKLIVQVF